MFITHKPLNKIQLLVDIADSAIAIFFNKNCNLESKLLAFEELGKLYKRALALVHEAKAVLDKCEIENDFYYHLTLEVQMGWQIILDSNLRWGLILHGK